MTDQTRETSELRRTLSACAVLVVVAWIASGTFLVAKKTTQVFDPIDLSWFRIELSFVIIWAMHRLHQRKRAPVRLSRGDILRLVGMGLSGVTINQMCFLYGIHYASPIDAALLYAFTPVMVLVAARFFLAEPIRRNKVLGILLAIAGVVLVLLGRGLAFEEMSLLGNGIILIAVAAWAAYTLLGKDLMARMDALRATAWAFGAGALSLLPLTYPVLEGFDWSAPGWAGWGGLLYLAGMTSAISFTLWTWALERLEASQAAVFTNLQPAFTAFLAWAILDEVPTLPIVIGGLAVIGGVVLVQRPRFGSGKGS